MRPLLSFALLWRTASVLAGIGMLSAPLAAQEQAAVHLDYVAVASCPSEQHFLRRLYSHTRRVQISDSPNALRLEVRVTKRNGRFVGRLTAKQGDDPQGARRIEDSDCAKVVAALALSSALSIDPGAELMPEPDPEGASAAEPGTAASDAAASGAGEPGTAASDAAASDTAEPSARGPGTGASSREDSAGPDTAEPSATPANPLSAPAATSTGEGDSAPSGNGFFEGLELDWSLGAHLASSFAFDPKAALGAGLSLGVHERGESGWPLEASLSVEYLTTRPTHGDDPFRFDWVSLRLGFCPLRGGGDWMILACAVAQGGLLQGEGVDIDSAQSVSRSFWTLGAGLRARGAIGAGWRLTGGIELGVPLQERSFSVNPDSVVINQSRPLALHFAIGASTLF